MMQRNWQWSREEQQIWFKCLEQENEVDLIILKYSNGYYNKWDANQRSSTSREQIEIEKACYVPAGRDFVRV